MFMLKSTHEAVIAEYATDLERMKRARDNWRDTAHAWKAEAKEREAKFKRAITDLEAETRRADANEADAEIWRNRLKRDRERRAAK